MKQPTFRRHLKPTGAEYLILKRQIYVEYHFSEEARTVLDEALLCHVGRSHSPTMDCRLQSVSGKRIWTLTKKMGLEVNFTSCLGFRFDRNCSQVALFLMLAVGPLSSQDPSHVLILISAWLDWINTKGDLLCKENTVLTNVSDACN